MRGARREEREREERRREERERRERERERGEQRERRERAVTNSFTHEWPDPYDEEYHLVDEISELQ